MDGTTETINSAPMSDFWDPLYDSFDLDLIVKVLAHTLFSACRPSARARVQTRLIFGIFRPVLYLLRPRLLLLPRCSLARAVRRLPRLLVLGLVYLL